MQLADLEAAFGAKKVAELTRSGRWPVPAWLLPYILDPNPARSGPPEFENPAAEQAYRELEALVASVTSAKS